jgi:serine/threonine protein kinase
MSVKILQNDLSFIHKTQQTYKMSNPEYDSREETTLSPHDLTYKCVHGIDTIYNMSKPLKVVNNVNGLVKIIESPEGNGARIAIKQFRDNHYGEYEEDIISEMHALEKIKGKHPSLCSIIELVADWTTHRFAIVMPFYPHDLMDVCNAERARSPVTVHRLAMNIAAGLNALHMIGVIHRDIWPDNIRVTDAGVACIIDFGSALDTTLLVCPNAPKYTNLTKLQYRAPELVADDGYYGSEIDIWSFGCVLIEMFTGQRFFAVRDNDTRCETTLRDVQELYKPPAPPAYVPLPGGWGKVKTPMTWDKKQRPTAAQVYGRLVDTLKNYNK